MRSHHCGGTTSIEKTTAPTKTPMNQEMAPTSGVPIANTATDTSTLSQMEAAMPQATPRPKANPGNRLQVASETTPIFSAQGMMKKEPHQRKTPRKSDNPIAFRALIGRRELSGRATPCMLSCVLCPDPSASTSTALPSFCEGDRDHA